MSGGPFHFHILQESKVKRKFRDENLREAKPKLRYSRKMCCALSGTVSGQWDLVAESQTPTLKQPQLLRDGVRYKGPHAP